MQRVVAGHRWFRSPALLVVALIVGLVWMHALSMAASGPAVTAVDDSHTMSAEHHLAESPDESPLGGHGSPTGCPMSSSDTGTISCATGSVSSGLSALPAPGELVQFRPVLTSVGGSGLVIDEPRQRALTLIDLSISRT